MDGFFQAGFGPDLMNRIEAVRGLFDIKRPPPCMASDLEVQAQRSQVYTKEARFQPGYNDENDDDPEQVRRMIRERKIMSKHSYDEFEDKLSNGILDVPNLNLHEVPSSIFDNEPPIKMVYIKCNQICELPEFFFDELPFLAWCDLRDNKLTNLPALASRHINLRVLLLQGNRIRTLPYSLGLAVNLQTIGLTGNPVTIPPENIQQQGCKKILEFLQTRMMETIPMDDAEEYESLLSITASQDDEKLRQDLKNTASKRVKPKSTTSLNIWSQTSSSTIDPKVEEKRRAEKIKYTWELWKRIPYDGISKEEVYAKSLEEARNLVLSKLNAQQETLLQKCKNKEVLRQWRSDTKLMQMTSKPDIINSNPTEAAPFGNDLNMIKPTASTILSPYEYKKEVEECWEKLKEFSANPVSLSNTELTLKRLKEVEDIHKRFLNAKLSMKPPIPTL